MVSGPEAESHVFFPILPLGNLWAVAASASLLQGGGEEEEKYQLASSGRNCSLHVVSAPATSSPATLILSQSCFIFRRDEIAKLFSILIYKMD